MPDWEPHDEIADEWNTAGTGWRTRANKLAAETAARGLQFTHPDASRNLLHYLNNSGEPLEQNVDRMLEDNARFEAAAAAREQTLIDQAIAQAQESGVDGPVTFPISTSWEGFDYSDGAADDQNWFYAVGAFDMGVSGTITVYPPTDGSDEWSYASETRIHMRDHYNWDPGKTTDIGPFTIHDDDLRRMHVEGIAQEFSMFGASDTRTSEGVY
jgi:hypothetical protein